MIVGVLSDNAVFFIMILWQLPIAEVPRKPARSFKNFHAVGEMKIWPVTNVFQIIKSAIASRLRYTAIFLISNELFVLAESMQCNEYKIINIIYVEAL